MPARRITILNGHPADASLSRQFADIYAEAARDAGHEVRVIHLPELEFDMDYGYAGYSRTKPLEPALEAFLADLEWAEHFVLTTPMWWGGLPGKLKGLIDRSFLPGRVFDTRVKPGTMPKPMLAGRTARVFLTSDTPGWFFRLLYKNALLWQLRGQILGFVGFKPAKITHFSGASDAPEKTIRKWFANVSATGRAGA